MEVGKSLNLVIKIIKNVENRPPLIKGMVMSFTDLNQEPPRIRDASSSSALICFKELLINRKETGNPFTIYPTKKIHKVPYSGRGAEEKQRIKASASATAGKDMALVFKKDNIFLPGTFVRSTIQAMIKEKTTAKKADPTPKRKLFFRATIKAC